MSAEVDEELHAFVSGRYVHLRRTAYLLCGDWHRAEDLVQTALARVVEATRRRRIDNLDAYSRTALTRVFLDDSRRLWRRRERPPGEGGDPVAVSTDPQCCRSRRRAPRAPATRFPETQRRSASKDRPPVTTPVSPESCGTSRCSTPPARWRG